MSGPQSQPSSAYPPVDPYFQQGPSFPPPYDPPASSLATASLVCGIAAWAGFFLIGALVAIITGHMALSEIRRNPGRIGGSGLAKVGLVLGYLQFVLLLIGITILIGFFVLVSSAVIASDQSPRPAVPFTVGATGDEIEKKVATILAPMAKMPAANIDSTDLLTDDLHLEDTDRINLLVALEQGFGIKIQPGASQSWKTVADVTRSVRDKTGVARMPVPLVPPPPVPPMPPLPPMPPQPPALP